MSEILTGIICFIVGGIIGGGSIAMLQVTKDDDE